MVYRSPFLCAAAGLLSLTFLGITATGEGAKPTPNVSKELAANEKSLKRPIALPGISIGNFGIVDEHIYRGEQPSGKDYGALRSIGVTTILDLRDDAKESRKRDAEAAGLKYINIGIDGHGTPTDAQAIEFLRIVDNPANGVVYVHCAGGRHRTGSMIAIYRMTRNNWTIGEAYNEMLAFDFYTSGGHKGFKTYVYDYFDRMTADPSIVPAVYHPAAIEKIAPAPSAIQD